MKGMNNLGEKNANGFFKAVKDKISADKKVIILIVCGILGMLLLLLTETSNGTAKNTQEQANDGVYDFSDYEKDLTDKVTELVSAVNGAGNVKVLLTLECYEEYVYAQDEEVIENKSEGNSNIEQKKSYIVIDNDKLQEGVLIKIVTPRVRGVGVVCDGGASPLIRQEITDILCAALGIGASKVHITQ